MLPTLLETPRSELEWERFAFHHSQDHDQIDQVLARLGFPVPATVIYPMYLEDLGGWLVRHQQRHIDMDAILGVQGVDLQSFNLNDERQLTAFINANYQEHFMAHAILKV